MPRIRGFCVPPPSVIDDLFLLRVKEGNMRRIRQHAQQGCQTRGPRCVLMMRAALERLKFQFGLSVLHCAATHNDRQISWCQTKDGDMRYSEVDRPWKRFEFGVLTIVARRAHHSHDFNAEEIFRFPPVKCDTRQATSYVHIPSILSPIKSSQA
eukprot:2472453-Rhodomonas_salina.1